MQDEVPSENFIDIKAVIESEFGQSLSEIYSDFDPIPLAAASLGQAHLANIQLTQEQVEVLDTVKENNNGDDKIDFMQWSLKVQRPNIEKIISTDLAAIRTVGGWIKRYPPIRKRVDVTGLVSEFSRTLYEEIDYLAEGRNAEIFAHEF